MPQVWKIRLLVFFASCLTIDLDNEVLITSVRPSMKTGILGKILLWTGAGVVCLGAGYFMEARQKVSNSAVAAGSSKLSELAVRSSRYDLTSTQKSLDFCLKTVKSGNIDSIDEFVARFKELHPDDQDYLLEDLFHEIHSDPEHFVKFTQELGIAFYKEKPEMGADFLLRMPRVQEILDVERSLLKDWLNEDPQAVRDLFSKRLGEQSIDSTEQMNQLAAIYSNEKKEDFDDWYRWVNGLDPKEEWSLFRSGLEASVKYSTAEQRPQVLANLLEQARKNEAFWDLPAEIIGKQAVDDPGAAAETLKDLPSGPWKDQALKDFLSSTGEHHPQKAIDFLKDPAFLDSFSNTWALEDDQVIVNESPLVDEAADQKFFDSALLTVLEQVLASDPQAVIDSADSFYDEELTTAFKAVANEYLSGSIYQSDF